MGNTDIWRHRQRGRDRGRHSQREVVGDIDRRNDKHREPKTDGDIDRGKHRPTEA